MTKLKQITGNIASPKGFTADATHAELKFQKLDLGMILSQVPAAVAGVFTTNKVAAAPVILDKEVVAGGLAQAIITNSAIANAVTGEAGMNNARKTQRLLADKFGLLPGHVAVCSTGVIGRQLPMDKIALGISKLSAENGHAAGFAQAILTTDLVEKEVAYQVELGGQTITVAGVCKGSGMIHPNMATMLAFITTDANIAQPLLQATLSEVIETTFNQITVDGDTSTNDTVLVLANGMAGNAELVADSEDYLTFKSVLATVCQTMAKQIAADGEGATKLIEVTVTGAPDELTARMIAKHIVGSSLVKTAIFGADPNWGRVISAIGQVAPFEVPDIELTIQNDLVLLHSTAVDFDQAELSEKLKEKNVVIEADLNQGDKTGTAWGCDLTYKYVEINALYHS
ncbi:bifunctional glutamate N-acetyltransferase/amino-acid acetyltransferase ArgJ [Pseudolactococcus paracarnosus]|uniref:Arginine biosynthesis bifunctional protein ArgJ n=1 Tax=Pseudolactococcus paracarnosus TaxID=2749962 RepID=A0A7L4WCB6_9LACT|nr:bifunctional glutamate N-acetyltransferase/amino-acid acetyltransferase ArgJ [Lactococcus paracarnosus]SPC35797.1 ornithine acetyltransferase; amino-acid acetyltransferase [Lactococcus piscium]MCJ1976547.1 bifunctional glutamate N-acetyltransferase/amino-acid acetyltransferase ArgJ [Lactococcus paracarnosus]MCJ1982662.1 bifunctional glutamate N-acetyltransferase/amino-acid acetyltransferase ArgJ [Lactococcus paracarnosus]MCJ1994499.1 bifunctional glutamate N-acetyltransferase/amino-acid acet